MNDLSKFFENEIVILLTRFISFLILLLETSSILKHRFQIFRKVGVNSLTYFFQLNGF